MARRVQKHLLYMTIGYLILMIGYTMYMPSKLHESKLPELVVLNEVEQLTKQADGKSVAQSQINELKHLLKNKERNTTDHTANIYGYLIISMGYVIFMFVYMNIKILRPFHVMEAYTQEIAKGNLNISLPYERSNFFGSFTWAFDHMRKEIQHARQNEAKAIQDQKTVIASLSHDIKTPIASIRAYAEGLEAGLDDCYEKKERYLQVIMKKCDEVTRLTNDLMQHAQAELHQLDMHPQPCSMKPCLEKLLTDLAYPQIIVSHPFEDAILWIDQKRMAQVLENIISNARKYAPDSKILIWTSQNNTQYEIHIKDHGMGIPPQDMPFIFDKFYRGSNAVDQEGSGLGLYIVSYILKQMNATISLQQKDGLEVILSFEKKEVL